MKGLEKKEKFIDDGEKKANTAIEQTGKYSPDPA